MPVRWKSTFVLLFAHGLLSACDNSADPFGLYQEPSNEVAAPLELTGRVVDAANIIPASKEAKLTRKLEALEQATLAQVVVVTTPTLGGSAIEDYGLALGRGWEIGDKDRNDGVILLVAPNDRKTRIEVGYGLEDVLTFERSQQIVDRMLVHFKDANYVRGIEVGVENIGTDLRLNTRTQSTETDAETKLAA